MNNKYDFIVVGKEYIYEEQIKQIDGRIKIRSKETRRIYRLAVLHFCRVVEKCGFNNFSISKCFLSFISDKELQDYVDYMKQKRFCNGTIKTNLAAIRLYHGHCEAALYQLSGNEKFNI